MRQLYCINQQQADKDMKIAEYYRRTGHSGSAYFYYEIVRRRYPGTAYFDKATERMHELRAELEHGQKSAWQWPNLLPWKAKEQEPIVPPPGQAAPAPPAKGPVPGTPLAREEAAPAPRTLPPDLAGSR
jgi:hypothetical protein